MGKIDKYHFEINDEEKGVMLKDQAKEDFIITLFVK